MKNDKWKMVNGKSRSFPLTTELFYLRFRSQPKSYRHLKHPRWTPSQSRVNLLRQLILAVAVGRRLSAVLEDHFKQCH